ncbi:hypothetical protein [Psychroserpens sp. Hel_I_66]|uniref:hypothetical protein n=1 Tax=Psychroserpens sp. Hel_I_66 TaxID=1250004 RepID=UPI0006917050|nr:hypothetical protein [Psychroserpens sp. Hel_I_66]
MRNILFIFFIGILALGCDDGDVFEVNFAFDEVLDLCEDTNVGNYLLYETKMDPSESRSLLFPIAGNTDVFDPPVYNSLEPFGYTKELTINGTSIRFNYRTYNGDPDNLICQSIPDPGTEILEDYSALAGANVIFLTTYEDDDNDGVPSNDEGRGIRAEDGTYPDAIDTDGDGIPNYLDQDDDNDNVLTINEIGLDEGEDIADALNTDLELEIANGETPVPNYLDSDDDGDGTPTINEDENSNSLLTDDFNEIGEINPPPRYLDVMATEFFTAGELLENIYTRTTVVRVTLNDVNLGIGNFDEIELGTYTFPTVFAEEEDE